MNVRSDIFKLTKRYWTDILSQKIRRLSINFYNDTQFADDTSMFDNKCSQIYTEEDGFVHVLRMRSKAGAGDSLGNVVKDIDITNEITYDNALEQGRTNAEFMSKADTYNIYVSSTKPC